MAQKKAFFEFKYGNAKPTDTLRMFVWDKAMSQRTSRQTRYRRFVSLGKNGTYRFVIDSLEGPVYFSLVKDRNRLLSDSFAPIFPWNLMEPGDNVKANADSLIAIEVHFPQLGTEIQGYRMVNLKLTGKGSAKTDFLYTLDRKTDEWVTAHMETQEPFPKIDSSFFVTVPDRFLKARKRSEIFADFQYNVLQSYRDKLSPTEWQILKANLVGTNESYHLSNYSYHRLMYKRDTTVTAGFKESLNNQLETIYNERKKIDMSDVSKDLLPYASQYVNFLSDEAYSTKKEQYFYLVSNYDSSLLRDKLITDLILKWMFHLKNSNAAIEDAVTRVSDPYYLSLVGNVYNTQRIGTEAYNFRLTDTKGKLIQLSDFRGKTVFIDLWYTGCGACASFYKYQLSRVEKHFEDNPDVVFITISIDVDKDRWIKSVNEGLYSSPHAPNVVNLYTNGLGSTHPLIKAYNVMGYPHPFMVDKNGKIYQINSLQAPAEEIIPVITQAISGSKRPKAF